MKGKCLNPIVLAWAAGFVDGEGCIRIAKRKNPSNPVYSLEITISQNCIETLEHFKEVLGIDCGRSRIHSATARVKSDVYYLTYRSQNALRLLRLRDSADRAGGTHMAGRGDQAIWVALRRAVKSCTERA